MEVGCLAGFRVGVGWDDGTHGLSAIPQYCSWCGGSCMEYHVQAPEVQALPMGMVPSGLICAFATGADFVRAFSLVELEVVHGLVEGL